MRIILSCAVVLTLLSPVTAGAFENVRAQVDTVGFATSWHDMHLVSNASFAVGDDVVGTRRRELGLAADEPWIAAIMPHDDYLYAGPTAVHVAVGLKAKRWIVVGVCHACRRLGVRDQLLFDSHDAWHMAGVDIPVAVDLRESVICGLGSLARVDDERQDAEHSVEALLPWLRCARENVEFVSVLVPTMDWRRLNEAADALAAVLVDVCRENGWVPGVDLGILISADAVHYGCEGWGGNGYQPFGCDEVGHAAGVAQDIMLAEATLAGELDVSGPADFSRLVWNPENPEYPYKITWCGVYSIPFGLITTLRWWEELGHVPLHGRLLRYGDSATDGRLDVPGSKLGVTAPANLQHWVGYPAVGYVPALR